MAERDPKLEGHYMVHSLQAARSLGWTREPKDTRPSRDAPWPFIERACFAEAGVR